MFEPLALVLDGRYRIVEVLGTGAVTEVYLAEQVELSRRVVLKVLRRELGVGENAVSRFREEVKRLAAADHPAVVRVMDFGVAADLLYLATELADGKTLEDELRAGPLVPDRGLALLLQIAEGLAAIHGAGIVHRDLRPQNVFLASGPKGERVRLVDFGIARLVDPDPGQERVTLMLQPIGRPEYASPEQARGAPTDARSDLYSFGVLAFEVLSGHHPFAGPGPEQYLQQHREAAPRPFDEAAPHLKDQLRIGELVMRCLEKDPARRPASAVEVLERLSKIPSIGEPTILVEALLSLPPALPVRALETPAERQAPAPSPAAPAAVEQRSPSPERAAGPLLPSIPMPVLGAATAPQPLVSPAPAAAAAPARKRWPFAVAGGALAAIGLVGLLSGSAATRARKLLEAGQPSEALAEIETGLSSSGDRANPELLVLKAAVLHRLDRHRDEANVLREQVAPRADENLDPIVLAGLFADYGRKDDAAARELLRRLPGTSLLPVAVKFARGDRSASQWGALRYLDTENAASDLDLVQLYVAELQSEKCADRRIAAKRLGQLGDDYAAEALERLKSTPRTATAERSCGQDEAAAALPQLRRKKTPGR